MFLQQTPAPWIAPDRAHEELVAMVHTSVEAPHLASRKIVTNYPHMTMWDNSEPPHLFVDYKTSKQTPTPVTRVGIIRGRRVPVTAKP